MVAKYPYKAKKQQGNNHIKEKHADGKINVDRIKRVTHYYEVKKDQPEEEYCRGIFAMCTASSKREFQKSLIYI